MIAEVIAIGDELASGQCLDTNSPWLSQHLGSIGIEVRFHTTVADDLDACASVFSTAAQRSDFVVSTGGLGPTADDLTRQALANATNRPLVLDPSSLDHIRHLFECRGLAMPQRNQVQAMLPEGSQVIPNPHGTAPGIDVTLSQPVARIFALPGVPAEMKQMYEGTVRATLIAAGAGKRMILHHRLKCFGLGESALEQRLPDLVRRGRQPAVGITVHQATITLRVTAEGKSETACRSAMQSTINTIHDCLGTIIFGEEDDELQDVIVRHLTKREQTLATCEWGTEGIMARWLREASATAPAYAGGLVLGANQQFPEALASAAAKNFGRVDAGAIRESATRVRKFFNADYGVVIGPAPEGGPSDPDGEVLVGLSTNDDTIVVPKNFAGHPNIVLARSVKHALNLLRVHLMEQEGNTH